MFKFRDSSSHIWPFSEYDYRCFCRRLLGVDASLGGSWQDVDWGAARAPGQGSTPRNLIILISSDNRSSLG